MQHLPLTWLFVRASRSALAPASFLPTWSFSSRAPLSWQRGFSALVCLRNSFLFFFIHSFREDLYFSFIYGSPFLWV